MVSFLTTMKIRKFKNNENLIMKKSFEDLMLSSNLNERARILVSSQAESSKWLQVLPSTRFIHG